MERAGRVSLGDEPQSKRPPTPEGGPGRFAIEDRARADNSSLNTLFSC
jgi:hypothetical protein